MKFQHKSPSRLLDRTMTYRTARLATFDTYLNLTDESAEEIAQALSYREGQRARFPWTVMLELAYPEWDYANRWCWRNMGPHHGECFQSRAGSKHSYYPVCMIDTPHSHEGIWTSRWWVKTDYDFGFAEWYFITEPDRNRFLQFEPGIHWGEKYDE